MTLVSDHSDEICDVLLELGEVVPDVVLVKLSVLIICLLVRHIGLEPRLMKHLDHLLHVAFDQCELVMHVVALTIRLLNVILQFISLVLQFLDLSLLLGFVLFG